MKTCLSRSFDKIFSLQDSVTIDIKFESVGSTTDSNTDTVPGPRGPNGEKAIIFGIQI